MFIRCNVTQRTKFSGTLQVPGDKSISHRALIFSLLASGECRVDNLSPAEDCQSTIRCLQQLGVPIRPADASDQTPQAPTVPKSGSYIITSPWLENLKSPQDTLDAGNSGTTIRLLSGLLAGSPITCTLDGDESLRKRPMARVLKPLTEMGAEVSYLANEGCPPFTIKGQSLEGKSFLLPVASAQVATALLLAGLQGEGKTMVQLPSLVRDHTERMFRYIGVPFDRPELLITIVQKLKNPVMPYHITVAGDISSAAFFMVAAACAPGSKIKLKDVGVNPGRLLIVDVLKEMGADLAVVDPREISGEPVADIIIKGGARLGGATITGDRIAEGIDEIPILALAGALCGGTLTVRDAAELRVKESDRLSAICDNLRKAGASVDERHDGFEIHGKQLLAGGSEWKTYGDHRLAMTGLVASLLCEEPLNIDDTACAAVSYPQFENDLASLAS